MQILLAIFITFLLGLTLGGCNRSPVQTAPAPSIHTSVDQVPPPQDTNGRVNAERRDTEVIIERPGLLGNRKVEIHRDAEGNAKREVTNQREDNLLRDRAVEVHVTPGQGVKVDVGNQ